MSGGVHEPTYPPSEEPTDARTARAVAALKYEEQAGLGFRRRTGTHGESDPYGNPEDFLVDGEETTAQLVGGYLAAVGVVAGIGAFFVKPLVLSVVALFFCIAGIISGGKAERIGRAGLIVACCGWAFGMLVAITWDRPVF
jgi:hypothetical protein